MLITFIIKIIIIIIIFIIVGVLLLLLLLLGVFQSMGAMSLHQGFVTESYQAM